MNNNWSLLIYRRGGLTSALSGREDRTLTPVLTFLSRHINDPSFTETLVQVTHVLLGNIE